MTLKEKSIVSLNQLNAQLLHKINTHTSTHPGSVETVGLSLLGFLRSPQNVQVKAI
jgi:hypothetical protein